MNKPMVYLIGAGPGDPWLISARGLRYLRTADVILHDHLVHPRILRYARPEAERIDVGPAAPEAMAQEAICYLLAEKAREGKVVARLKWGDPFVFDRGGEEALFLHEQGVPFEVVPGIPAAIAVPAYAGVPITYPGGGDTVTIVRGYEDERQKRPQIDWASLAKLHGTVVCYAGAQQLPAILDAMLAHGWTDDDPAALVFRGTLPDQDTLSGTLGELVAAAKRPKGREPAILVVGRVAGLRDHLRWFDVRPLFGKRIVVTRPREQAGELIERLEALGATVIEAPTVRIAPPDDLKPLDDASARAGSFDWIVFTSVNSVEQFLQRLQAGPGDVRSLKGARLCAIGPGTADRLARLGLKADLTPPEFRTDSIASAIQAAGPIAGNRVLLLRADAARDLLADRLRKAGADVTDVVAYRSLPVDADDPNEPDIYRMLLDGQVDVVTFTSPSTVQHFVAMLGRDQAADLLRPTVVAAIGPVTAEAAAHAGVTVNVTASEYTMAGLVQAIVDYFSATDAPAGQTA